VIYKKYAISYVRVHTNRHPRVTTVALYTHTLRMHNTHNMQLL